MSALARIATAVTGLATPHLATSVRVSGSGIEARLEAHAVVLGALTLGPDAYMPPVTPIGPASFSMAHALVPATLLAALLLAWPAGSRREAALRAVLFLPAAAMVTVATAAVHLAGLLDMALLDAAARAGAPRSSPWTVSALLFLESGGRWLLAFVLGAACIALARIRPRPPGTARERRPLDVALIESARRVRLDRHGAGAAGLPSPRWPS